MKVLQISPALFAADGTIGGGERYAYELARALAARAEVRLLTFAVETGVARQDGLTIERLRRGPFVRWNGLAVNPLRPRFVRLVRWADVVHVHQVSTLATAAAAALGRMFGKPVFVTDLGGGHPYAPTAYLPLLRGVEAMLLLSEYSRRLWDQEPPSRRPARLEVVYGGVDVRRFAPGGGAVPRPGRVLFVGRVLPHKGLDYLIDAIEPPLTLTIVGRRYDRDYAASLERKAAGRAVTFLDDATDRDLVDLYRSAMVTVLPSVYETAVGSRSRVPELLGLVVLESMACGTPVVVTDVASLPEIVEDGVTGFIVPPNDSAAIRERLRQLAAHPEDAGRMGQQGRQVVLERFTWDAVAERCLQAYASGRDRAAAQPS